MKETVVIFLKRINLRFWTCSNYENVFIRENAFDRENMVFGLFLAPRFNYTGLA